MDPQRFDRLTTSLATGASRRTLLRGLATAIGAGVLGRVGVPEAAAAAPCAKFCQDVRAAAHKVCPHAGGGTIRSVLCDPRGDEDGICANLVTCLNTSEHPDGPADAEFCQNQRELCEDVCGDADQTSFRCSPIHGMSSCACIG